MTESDEVALSIYKHMGMEALLLSNRGACLKTVKQYMPDESNAVIQSVTDSLFKLSRKKRSASHV